MKKFARILPYYARYKGELALGWLCIPFSMALELAIPIVIGKGIDRLRTDPVADVLLVHAGLVVGFALLKGAFRYGMRLKITGVSRKVETELKDDLFRHLAKLPFSFFNRARTGDLLSRATQDVEAVRMFTGPGFMYVSSSLVALPIAFAIMLTIDWKLTLVVAVPLIGLAYAVKLLTPRLHKHSQAIQDDLGELSVLAQENFAGVRVVKAFHREEAEIEKFRAKCLQYAGHNLQLASARGLSNALIDGSKDVAFVLILGIGSFDLIAGRLTLGDYFVFNSYVLMLFWPLIALGWIVGMYHRAVAAMGRIDELFREMGTDLFSLSPSEIRAKNKSVPISGEIEFRDLSFAYEGAPALSGIRLKIRKGETVGIVGRTGAGKTTLVSLIPRLFPPPPGTLFLDERDALEIPIGALRPAIGFVPQENFLFSDTLKENIGFGLAETRDEAIVRSAEAAKIAEEIRAFPKGFEQVIGERGVTLSGGQKQRASIARALAIEPRILIFDDCLSAVDPETERELIENLRRAAAGRTTLLVAHRLSIVQHADRIVVLDGGKIAEQGSHAELLKAGGWYARTWKRQRIEQELEVL